MQKHVIAPAPTSVTAIVGNGDKGPRDTPVPVKSFDEFWKVFGSRSPSVGGAMMTGGVQDFFLQGGTDAIILNSSEVDALHGSTFNILAWSDDPTDLQLAADLCAQKQAMAILQTPQPSTDAQAAAGWFDGVIKTNREWAAVYYPRLVNDIPACGAIAGRWARNDRESGPWKAPCWPHGGTLHGVTPMPQFIEHDEVVVLAKVGANSMGMDTRMAGETYIWTAFTMAAREGIPDGPRWTIQFRRTLIFIQQSLKSGLQWAAQEPNGPELWSDVAGSAGEFLATLATRGAFAGGGNSGYAVTCDATNNQTGSHVVHLIAKVALNTPGDFETIAIDVPTA